MKKTISISLALILLVSNIGLALTTHFCGGHAVESNLLIGVTDLNCGMQAMDADKHTHPESGTFLSTPPCCDNDYQVFQLEDDVEASHQFTTFQFNFVPVFVQSELTTSLYAGSTALWFVSYTPPLITEEVLISIQTFRI